jgi:adenine/guanine phosphoribosyltransferase-like PRPP-binding protein
MSHASWIRPSVDPDVLLIAAKHLSRRIKLDRHKLDINCIAVTGVSGLVMGGAVSALTGLPLVIVRKEGQSERHSSHDVEYLDSLYRFDYCIIDDLISSGNTIRRIVSNINRTISDSSLKKIYLYQSSYKGTFDYDDLKVPVYGYKSCED